MIKPHRKETFLKQYIPAMKKKKQTPKIKTTVLMIFHPAVVFKTVKHTKKKNTSFPNNGVLHVT